MTITIVNKKTYKGEGEYIGRPSPLGNPFKLSAGYSRSDAISLYKQWLTNQMEMDSPAAREISRLVDMCLRCEDVILICWCAPNACHGDIVKEFIESELSKLGEYRAMQYEEGK